MIFVHSLMKNLAIALQIIRCDGASLTTKSRARTHVTVTDTRTHTLTHRQTPVQIHT